MLNMRFGLLVSLCLLGFGTTFAAAEEAADFPPGTFSDSGKYSLSELRGKVVVLFFFEETCPRCRGMVPERNKLVQSLKDKPVKFLIDPGHTLADANTYIQETKLTMPVYADPLRVMEARWKQHISLNNIYQWRVIAPDGSVAAFTDTEIQKVVATATWKYKDKGYNAKLNGAIEAFEWNQYGLGMRLLTPLLKDKTKAVADDAHKLLADIKAEGEAWKSEADKAIAEDPVHAFELYLKIADVFAGDELGKSVADPIKKLKTNKAIKDEAAARQMYIQLASVMSKAKPEQKGQVVQFCASIATRYPETPTGKKAAAFAEELKALL